MENPYSGIAHDGRVNESENSLELPVFDVRGFLTRPWIDHVVKAVSLRKQDFFSHIPGDTFGENSRLHRIFDVSFRYFLEGEIFRTDWAFESFCLAVDFEILRQTGETTLTCRRDAMYPNLGPHVLEQRERQGPGLIHIDTLDPYVRSAITHLEAAPATSVFRGCPPFELSAKPDTDPKVLLDDLNSVLSSMKAAAKELKANEDECTMSSPGEFVTFQAGTAHARPACEGPRTVIFSAHLRKIGDMAQMWEAVEATIMDTDGAQLQHTMSTEEPIYFKSGKGLYSQIMKYVHRVQPAFRARKRKRVLKPDSVVK
jgi:hypothetical protein